MIAGIPINLNNLDKVIEEAQEWVRILEEPWVVVADQFVTPYCMSVCVLTECSKPGLSRFIVATVDPKRGVMKSDWLKSQLALAEVA